MEGKYCTEACKVCQASGIRVTRVPDGKDAASATQEISLEDVALELPAMKDTLCLDCCHNFAAAPGVNCADKNYHRYSEKLDQLVDGREPPLLEPHGPEAGNRLIWQEYNNTLNKVMVALYDLVLNKPAKWGPKRASICPPNSILLRQKMHNMRAFLLGEIDQHESELQDEIAFKPDQDRLVLQQQSRAHSAEAELRQDLSTIIWHILHKDL
jgi:hypothetical protein